MVHILSPLKIIWGWEVVGEAYITSFFQAPGQAPLLRYFTQLSTPPSKLLSASITFPPLTLSADTQCLPYFLKTFLFQNLINDAFRPALLSSNVSFCADAPLPRLLSQGLRAFVLQWFRNLSPCPSSKDYQYITVYNLIQ